MALGQRWVETWKHNLRQGFVWDNDCFLDNQLAHPYHGSMYHNAARASGYGFWSSLPFVAAGSAGWELFGENIQASLNDLITTTVGGMALGEVTYRLSGLLTSRRGGARLGRGVGRVRQLFLGVYQHFDYDHTPHIKLSGHSVSAALLYQKSLGVLLSRRAHLAPAREPGSLAAQPARDESSHLTSSVRAGATIPLAGGVGVGGDFAFNAAQPVSRLRPGTEAGASAQRVRDAGALTQSGALQRHRHLTMFAGRPGFLIAGSRDWDNHVAEHSRGG